MPFLKSVQTPRPSDGAPAAESPTPVSPGLSGRPVWTAYDFVTPEMPRALDERVGQFLDDAGAESIKDDPRHLISAIDRNEASCRLYLLEDGEVILCAASFTLEETRLSIMLGPILLRRQPVRRVRISFVEPVFLKTIDEAQRVVYLDQLLAKMARDLEPADVIFFEAVPMDSALIRATRLPESASNRAFRMIPYGAEQPHWLASLPPTYDDFMERLGSQTRQSVRRYARKFTKHVKDDYTVKKFTDLDDVDRFLDDAMAVSESTWQFRNEGAGLRNRAVLERVLKNAARHGWLRSYILYAKGEPVAFILGYQYGARYDYDVPGYDPDWRDQRVGNFLIFEVIRDLIESDSGLTTFDFGATDNPLKRRTGNSLTMDGYFYLFPRTLRGSLTAFSVKCANGATDLVKALRDKLSGRRDDTTQS